MLLTTMEKNKARENLKIGDKYYKCVVFGAWLSDVGAELWGYSMGDLKQAKKDFNKALVDGLDGGLDYGFMFIHEYEKVAPFKKEGDNKIYHAKRVNTYVNYFGKWLTYEKYREVAYGN